jgi:hypothetical protein
MDYYIGQASPGDIGGAGGTYMYDQTNSQWLFVAGGAGTNTGSPNPDGGDPGDGSGGAAGSGGGSGAGVNSNGADSAVGTGTGGITHGNGGSGGPPFDYAQPGGYGGGGGGTSIFDPDIQPFGQAVYYPGGSSGYTGGTTYTEYYPEISAFWYSNPGTSYVITGATVINYNNNIGTAPVTNGYIHINPT